MENRIRAILKDKGLRMSDLAARVGMGQSNLVASLRSNPKLSTLEEICKALGIELSELFGGKTDTGEGIIILGGETFSVSKPNSRTVQLPVYTDYAVLRNDIKKFVKTRIAGKSFGVLCGMVENFQFFNLTYDHDNNNGTSQFSYEKFILTICYGNKRVWTQQYDLYEYSQGADMKWDTSAVVEDIINDIEGYVLGNMVSDLNSPTTS